MIGDLLEFKTDVGSRAESPTSPDPKINLKSRLKLWQMCSVILADWPELKLFFNTAKSRLSSFYPESTEPEVIQIQRC